MEHPVWLLYFRTAYLHNSKICLWHQLLRRRYFILCVLSLLDRVHWSANWVIILDSLSITCNWGARSTKASSTNRKLFRSNAQGLSELSVYVGKRRKFIFQIGKVIFGLATWHCEMFFVAWAISRCLSITPHPVNRARGLYTSCSLHYDRMLTLWTITTYYGTLPTTVYGVIILLTTTEAAISFFSPACDKNALMTCDPVSFSSSFFAL